MTKQEQHLVRQIERLEQKYASLTDQARGAQATMNRMRLELVEIQYGVKLGAVVRSTRHGRLANKLVKVTTINAKYGDGKPWVSGSPQKKDGEFGKNVINLFSDWEVVE